MITSETLADLLETRVNIPGETGHEAAIADGVAARLDLAAVTDQQGWTDVARFTEAGVAAFNFGPGVPERAHQAGEYFPIENLGTAYRWLAEFPSGGER